MSDALYTLSSLFLDPDLRTFHFMTKPNHVPELVMLLRSDALISCLSLPRGTNYIMAT